MATPFVGWQPSAWWGNTLPWTFLDCSAGLHMWVQSSFFCVAAHNLSKLLFGFDLILRHGTRGKGRGHICGKFTGSAGLAGAGESLGMGELWQGRALAGESPGREELRQGRALAGESPGRGAGRGKGES